MNRDIDLYKPMMGNAVKEACCMRKKTRFRCAAQRGWYFITGEGYVGFLDTRRGAETRSQRNKTHYLLYLNRRLYKQSFTI